MLHKRITRRDFLKFSCVTILNSFLAGVAGYGYGHLIEPGWLDIEEVKLTLPRLSPAFSGIRIAQISDIHMGDWMTRERFAQVVQNVITQDPDLVVITGDFVIGHNKNEKEAILTDLAEELSVLAAQQPTLAVLGNHDYWLDAIAVRKMLIQCGIREIGNNVYTMERDSHLFQIAGIDDAYEKHDRLDIVLKKLSGKNASVLLVHEPDFADQSAATGHFDLQVSGHSHGGQVVIPFIGAPILPYLGWKYPLGLYRVGDMWQYTNRGVGMSTPNIRLNCRPEITLFTLEAL